MNTMKATTSSQGARITDKAAALLANIAKGAGTYSVDRKAKVALAEHFAETFGLGLTYAQIEGDPRVISIGGGAAVDVRHCNPSSHKVGELVRGSKLTQFPLDDHTACFYELLPVGEGQFVAVCTASISMPYLEGAKDADRPSCNEFAQSIGWECSWHDEWSWHWPGRTALAVYRAKTTTVERAQAWATSFKKWVIERQGTLRDLAAVDPQELRYAIQDVVCDDCFPLDAESFDDLKRRYLDVYFGWVISAEREEQLQMLFTEWQREVVGQVVAA